MKLNEKQLQELRKVWKIGQRQSAIRKHGCGVVMKYDLPEEYKEQERAFLEKANLEK